MLSWHSFQGSSPPIEVRIQISTIFVSVSIFQFSNQVSDNLFSVFSEDSSESTIFDHFNDAYNTSLQFSRKFGSQKDDNSSIQTTLSVCEENPPIHHFSPPLSSESTIFHSNFCQNFAFPPPPPGDRRRPGPRRKFFHLSSIIKKKINFFRNASLSCMLPSC